MMKVNIIEKFERTSGTTIKILNDRIYKIGDVIEADSEKLTIQRIIMPTRPADEEYVFLVVK